jgi:predicted nuclease of restriction endonuclease-like (RecB) superfamily
MAGPLDAYSALLADVKARIAGGRIRAALAASRELLVLYWEIGQLIDERQAREGWGAAVIPRLAADLARDLPAARGFSERNLKRMVQFFHAYPEGDARVGATRTPPRLAALPIGPQAVAQLEAHEIGPQAVAQTRDAASLAFELPWGHNIMLLAAPLDADARGWYLRTCLAEGWSRDVLGAMIKSRAHERQGAAVTNFAATLPAPQSDLAQQVLKDPYVFDFLALDAGFRERELEAALLTHLERFLIELGVGFAFVGRQVRLALGDDEFFVDLLFYHLKLRCYVVVELKVGAFEAEHAGKMNLYLNLVDDTLRHPSDTPSIGLILCQDKKRLLAEYALRGMDRPIGVSEYELTRSLPAELASSLPTIDAIEAALSSEVTR